MKFFLTSSGLTNANLTQAFCELVPKPVATSRVAFIPTGANVYTDTSWLDDDIKNLRGSGVGDIDMIDISKLDSSEWVPRCREADVLWFNGGNTYYLLDWIRRSGMSTELRPLLQDKIYAGVSAGSMVAGPSVESNTSIFPEEDDHKTDDLEGLKLVPFAVIPHLNSPNFPHARTKTIEKFANSVSYPVYALDDQSALVSIDGSIDLVSEGEYRAYNQ